MKCRQSGVAPPWDAQRTEHGSEHSEHNEPSLFESLAWLNDLHERPQRRGTYACRKQPHDNDLLKAAFGTKRGPGAGN
jgi:hypothetical protein